MNAGVRTMQQDHMKHRFSIAVCALFCMTLLVAGRASADTVRGTVVDQSGNPIVNADFNVYDAQTGDKLAPSDNTDAAGKYSLLVDPGRYDILCQPDINSGYAPRIVRGVLVNGTVTLDFTLPPASQVRVRVRKASDLTGVFPCDLDFDRTDDGTRQPALGDLTGLLGTAISVVEAGSYTVTATPADTALAPLRVFGHLATVPSDPTILDFLLPAARFIAGTIRDSNGQPVQGVSLKFDDANGKRQPSTRGTSNASGFFRIGIAPGTYRVTVEPPAGSNLAAIRVADVNLTNHLARDFTLQIGVAVSGRVTDRVGQPVALADWDAILEADGLGAATPNDNTEFDGTYRFVVAPGVYRLRVTPPTSSGLDSVVFRNVALVRDTTINVDYAALNGGGAGSSPVVRFVPQGNPTHTTAAFTLVLNRAIANAKLELFDVGGKRVRVLRDGALAAGTQSIAWDGRRDNGAQAHTGVYFLRAQLDGHEQVTRIVLLP